MEKQSFSEWKDKNSLIKYPFTDFATLTNNSVFIPNNLFYDAKFFTYEGLQNQYISKVSLTADVCTVAISDSSLELCYAEFDLTDIPNHLTFIDTFGRESGVMLSSSDNLSLLRSWGVGDHTFSYNQTAIAASCLIPTQKTGILGFVTEDGSIFSRDVTFVGCDGVKLSKDASGFLRIDIIGEPLFLRKIAALEGEEFENPKFIGSVAGRIPDDNGNIFIVVGSSNDVSSPILRISSRDNTLKYEFIGVYSSG
jgi:hypothetical protein